jgi:opacity protein-like surface antigen
MVKIAGFQGGGPMKPIKVGGKQGKMGLGVIVALLTICLLSPGPTPALAGNSATNLAIGASIIGVIGSAALAYGIYENLPENQGKPRYFDGEFYTGAFGGASLLQDADWSFSGLPTAKNVAYTPGVVGGLKFGYFTHSYPWFGAELETNFTRQDVYLQTVALSQPLLGATQANLQKQSFYLWTNAIHFMARYGFFPDQEVPFGRLQPYVGIGPGFVVVYGRDDSAKNFSLEVQAGLRYMMLKNVSAFLEYKFSKQWNIEMEDQVLYTANFYARRTATLDVDSHKIVIGVACHF